MNRHHMALFVRNCRLILLLRKNFNEGDLNIFSPAEWRWKIPQACDNEWHHYTVNVDLPKVELYIDGNKFETNTEDRHSNPEVIDDWPLHAAHGVNTTLTIAACYQGTENRLKHGFSGDISEIKLSLRKILTSDEIKCGTDCAEHLLPPPEHYLEPEQQIQTNTQLNEITIEGNNEHNIELLLQKIQYINRKSEPTIGRRNIEIKTMVTCANKKSVRLPTIDSYIMLTQQVKEQNHIHDKPINEQQKPQIKINGNSNNLVSYHDIKNGVKILSNINITVNSGGHLNLNLQKLDECSVTVFPSLNPDHEEISIENVENLSPALDIKTTINKDGAELIGYDTIDNYFKVLKSLIYINKKPAYYLNRVFKLTCAQANTHFKSAEFTLTLTVLHPKQQINLTTNLPIAQQQHENSYARAMIHSHEVHEPQNKLMNIRTVQQNSHSTMLIVVICILFVVLICGVGIARLRNNTNKPIVGKHQPCPKVGFLFFFKKKKLFDFFFDRLHPNNNWIGTIQH